MSWRKTKPTSFDSDEFNIFGHNEENDEAEVESETVDFEEDSGGKRFFIDSNPEACWQKALYLLARQDYTVARLRRKLATEFSISAVRETLERACENGYLNDDSYAERFISNRRDSKSRQEIRQALRERGIALDGMLFDELYPVENEKEVILSWLHKRYRPADEETDDRKQRWQLRRKIYQALMRRGFGYESIDAAINTFMNPLDEE